MQRILTSITQLLGFSIIALTLSGCGGKAKTPTPMPPVIPTQAYTEPEDRNANPGSLYSVADANDLYADNRARKVGDIIMVNIVENSKSQSKADTSASKTSTNQYSVAAAFGGRSVGLLGTAGGGLKGEVGINPLLSSSSASTLSATGQTKRENYVTASISARVLQVLPGGLLQLAGYREIRVNDETQYMVVSGLARTSDIASDNSILSTQMADSKVEYYGEGVIADKQRPGWLTRLIDNIWPF